MHCVVTCTETEALVGYKMKHKVSSDWEWVCERSSRCGFFYCGCVKQLLNSERAQAEDSHIQEEWGNKESHSSKEKASHRHQGDCSSTSLHVAQSLLSKSELFILLFFVQRPRASGNSAGNRRSCTNKPKTHCVSFPPKIHKNAKVRKMHIVTINLLMICSYYYTRVNMVIANRLARWSPS